MRPPDPFVTSTGSAIKPPASSPCLFRSDGWADIPLAVSTKPSDWSSDDRDPDSAYFTNSLSSAGFDRHSRFDSHPVVFSSSDLMSFMDIDPHTVLLAARQDEYLIPPVSGRPNPSRFDDRFLDALGSVTVAHKNLLVRVASAADRLQSWCHEVDSWHWAGRLEFAHLENRPRKQKDADGNQTADATTSDIDNSGSDYELNPTGGLAVNTAAAKQYQRRIGELTDALAGLQMNEAKRDVMAIYTAHFPTGLASNPGPVRFIDDVSLLSTQFLMVSLPLHARLRDLLSCWRARLELLRLSPPFLHDLAVAGEQIERATRQLSQAVRLIEKVNKNAISTADLPAEAADLLASLVDAADKLSMAVPALDRRLDQMLSWIDDMGESLPDAWVSRLEEVEADYTGWTHQFECVYDRLSEYAATRPVMPESQAEETDVDMGPDQEPTDVVETFDQDDRPDGWKVRHASRPSIRSASASSAEMTVTHSCETSRTTVLVRIINQVPTLVDVITSPGRKPQTPTTVACSRQPSMTSTSSADTVANKSPGLPPTPIHASVPDSQVEVVREASVALETTGWNGRLPDPVLDSQTPTKQVIPISGRSSSLSSSSSPSVSPSPSAVATVKMRKLRLRPRSDDSAECKSTVRSSSTSTSDLEPATTPAVVAVPTTLVSTTQLSTDDLDERISTIVRTVQEDYKVVFLSGSEKRSLGRASSQMRHHPSFGSLRRKGSRVQLMRAAAATTPTIGPSQPSQPRISRAVSDVFPASPRTPQSATGPAELWSHFALVHESKIGHVQPGVPSTPSRELSSGSGGPGRKRWFQPTSRTNGNGSMSSSSGSASGLSMGLGSSGSGSGLAGSASGSGGGDNRSVQEQLYYLLYPAGPGSDPARRRYRMLFIRQLDTKVFVRVGGGWEELGDHLKRAITNHLRMLSDLADPAGSNGDGEAGNSSGSRLRCGSPARLGGSGSLRSRRISTSRTFSNLLASPISSTTPGPTPTSTTSTTSLAGPAFQKTVGAVAWSDAGQQWLDSIVTSATGPNVSSPTAAATAVSSAASVDEWAEFGFGSVGDAGTVRRLHRVRR